ncbi:hypothetical protein FHX51_000270 [Aeriscardovia aeriphila]|nr:hypothetical protein [Aeriscardovia aeriphila]
MLARGVVMLYSEVCHQTHFEVPEHCEPIVRYLCETVNLNGGLFSVAPGGRKMYLED